MDAIRIGSRRELCWDEVLIEQSQGITIPMHKPQYRGTALRCDKPWEGNGCGYSMVFRDGSVFRMYYRAAGLEFDSDGNILKNSPGRICYAESMDGKTFYKPDLGIVEYDGRLDNNIILSEGDIDNFSVFKDENPDCPPDELYKGLTGEFHGDEKSGFTYSLTYYKSRDGIHFTKGAVAITDGAFDSLNLAFWDVQRKEYLLYFRDLHDYVGNNKWTGIRDIRVCRSKDFKHWSEPQRIEYGEGKPDFHMYTNMIKPYARAPHIYLGTPTRYIDRVEDRQNYNHLPDYDRRAMMTRLFGRSGTAMTDCLLMFSRDGLHFERRDEAFFTPGPQRAHNWYYGDCYPSWGMIQTKADRPGGPDELSFFCGEHYRVEPIEFMRLTMRLDGFFSWQAGYGGGRVLTKPLIFEGEELRVNFATSAAGYLRVTLLQDGKPVEGFDSGRLFGDDVNRPVEFEGKLSGLAGKPVQMQFELCDAEIFSFKFNEAMPF